MNHWNSMIDAMEGRGTKVSFWLTRIYEEAMALTTARLSTHVRTRTVIAVATSAQRRGTTTPTGTPTRGRTLQYSSRTPHCVTSTGVRVTTWSQGGSAVRGPSPSHAGTTRHSVRKMEARGSSSGAIWRLTVVIAVREHVKATVAVVLDASGPDRLMQRVLKAASSYRQLLSVSKHPGPVLITLATDVMGSHSTTIGSCPTSRLVTPRDASSE